MSKQLDHHSIKITVDTCYHWIPGTSKLEVDQLNGNGNFEDKKKANDIRLYKKLHRVVPYTHPAIKKGLDDLLKPLILLVRQMHTDTFIKTDVQSRFAGAGSFDRLRINLNPAQKTAGFRLRSTCRLGSNPNYFAIA